MNMHLLVTIVLVVVSCGIGLTVGLDVGKTRYLRKLEQADEECRMWKRMFTESKNAHLEAVAAVHRIRTQLSILEKEVSKILDHPLKKENQDAV